ncbi:MAG: cytochrome P450 [Thermoleophilaceae bacterium]|nr:cytochrome P450 [Thermoleophilaceae bacterium]
MTETTKTPSLPPGPRWPMALSTLAWWTRPIPFMARMARRYGDMFTVRIAHEGNWVFVSHPDAIKQVFTADPRVAHAGEANRILLPVLGPKSVLLLDEAEHMRERKLMLPSLHGERVQRYGGLMTEIAQREIASWPVGQRFEVWPRMQAVTLEVILHAVFGIRDAQRLADLRRLLPQVLAWVSSFRQTFWLGLVGPERASRSRDLRATLAPVDRILIDEARRRREAPDLEEREDILSLLVQARHEDGSPMSEDELRDELMTLLVAGHETTATALAWAVERLVRHPDKLERLRAEVEAGEDAYLDAVTKETLRLRPALPIVLRRLTTDFEVGGHLLPAGTRVAPCIYLVHRRPDVYPQPQRFLPERFLERPAGTYTWIPFGGGVRRCLGAAFAVFEMKAVLRALVSMARLRPVDPAPELTRRRVIVHSPSRGGAVIADEIRREAPAAVPAEPAPAAA